jgi:signal transduction histidine kinase
MAQPERSVLAEEQAALRRVATLVAQGAPADDLFAAVAHEVASVLGIPSVTLNHHRADGMLVVVASLDSPTFPVGSRWPLDAPGVAAAIEETGGAARIDYSNLGGPVAAAARDASIGSAVGVPIVVDGKVWGDISVTAREAEVLPDETERRLHDFTELLGLAISNAESREALRILAVDQAALRRVATLVAEGASADEVYAAVAREAAKALDLKVSVLVRFDPGEWLTVMASFNSDRGFPGGSRFAIDGGVSKLILDTGKAARVDTFEGMPGTIAAAARASGENSSFGVPVVVEGAVWGMLAGDGVGPEPLPWDVEPRLRAFTELVATAISNTESRDALRRVADEQAALRRVATLVAEGASPDALFSAVVREVAAVLDVSAVTLDRDEPDGTSVTVARHVVAPAPEQIGVADGVFRTPITVDGEEWGVISVVTREGAVLHDTEARLHAFAELVATAVSNATARADLVASRARIVAAGDEARKRIERDLHDGTQQRLVTIGMDLRRLENVVAAGGQQAVERLREVRGDVRALVEEVRELSRGLHPAVLAEAGLEPSLRALARRTPFPVDLNVDLGDRLPESIEIGAYYLASEALTNAVKHAQATSAAIEVAVSGSDLRVSVADDGVGGARVGRGSGLEGLADRVAALGGRLALDSPQGRGTRLVAVFPIDARETEAASRAEASSAAALHEHLRALAAAAEVFDSAGSDGAVYALDRYGNIEYMDERGLQILGYDGDELRGKPDHETIHYLRRDGTPFPAVDCPLLGPWTAGETRGSDDDWFVTKDGSFVNVGYTAAPLPLADVPATLVAFRVR